VIRLLDASFEHPLAVFFGFLSIGLALIGIGLHLHHLDRKERQHDR
jgi:hypothetical protein